MDRNLTVASLERIVGRKLTAAQKANAASVLNALDKYGPRFGLDQSHRQAQFLAQLLHESGTFRYDREIASGSAYEGRKDLGNTQKGDGKRFKGRGPIQITGRSNYRQFTAWAKKIDTNAPNFEATPDSVNIDPWEGLGPVWYWSSRDLNKYADQGNIEMVTKTVNGGTNGFDDRVKWYARTALVMLGYGPNDLKAFQKFAKVKQDGVPGPVTRAALHKALVQETKPAMRAAGIMSAPVVEERKVVPKEVDKEVQKAGRRGVLGVSGSTVLYSAASWVDGADWQKIAAIVIAGLILTGLYLLFERRALEAIDRIREKFA